MASMGIREVLAPGLHMNEIDFKGWEAKRHIGLTSTSRRHAMKQLSGHAEGDVMN